MVCLATLIISAGNASDTVLKASSLRQSSQAQGGWYSGRPAAQGWHPKLKTRDTGTGCTRLQGAEVASSICIDVHTCMHACLHAYIHFLLVHRNDHGDGMTNVSSSSVNTPERLKARGAPLTSAKTALRALRPSASWFFLIFGI